MGHIELNIERPVRGVVPVNYSSLVKFSKVHILTFYVTQKRHSHNECKLHKIHNDKNIV